MRKRLNENCRFPYKYHLNFRENCIKRDLLHIQTICKQLFSNYKNWPQRTSVQTLETASIRRQDKYFSFSSEIGSTSLLINELGNSHES